MTRNSSFIWQRLDALHIRFSILEDVLGAFCVYLLNALDVENGKAYVRPLNFSTRCQHAFLGIGRLKGKVLSESDCAILSAAITKAKDVSQKRNHLTHGEVDWRDGRLSFQGKGGDSWSPSTAELREFSDEVWAAAQQIHSLGQELGPLLRSVMNRGFTSELDKPKT